MFSKSVSIVLVVLFILIGLLGAYAYTLNQQAGSLSQRLEQYQVEQGQGFAALADRLADIDDTFETTGKLIQNRLDDLESEAGDISSQIELLEDEMAALTELSQSQINTREVYAQAVEATVRIGDGEWIIGSGFIYDTDGHVVTASHVVEELPEIYVILPDGRVSKASLVGNNQRSDVAVLNLEETLAVTPLKLADSDEVVIGEPVAIIGSPLDSTESVTAGIVSQKDLFIEVNGDSGTSWVANIIQFDAAANFGNSGGPLLNRRGEVIGIVTARVNPERGDGIYYAVSSNKIKRVADALIEYGTYDYPWLGLLVTDLTPQLAESRNLKTINGIVVNEVVIGSPAQKAGLKYGDIIVAINGVTIRELADLQSYLGEHISPNDVVSISVNRNGYRFELSLKVGGQQS